MAKRKARQEAPSDGPSAAEAVKRRRRGARKDEDGSEVQPAPPDAATVIQKRGRGRPPSAKTLKKRRTEAKNAAEAAAASEPAEKSPIVNSGPSLEDQMKRLQEDKAGEGSGLTRRRSCSMHRLYNMTKMNSKPGRGLRLRKASNGNTEEIEVDVEEKPIEADGGVGPSGVETPTEGAVEAAAADASPRELPSALAAEEGPAQAASEPAADKSEPPALPPPQAGYEEPSQEDPLQEEQAATDSKPFPAKKADSAPLQTEAAPDAEEFGMQDSKPADAPAPTRPASAPVKRASPKSSPENKTLGEQAKPSENALVKRAPPKNRPEEKPLGKQAKASENMPVKRASPKSSSEYIPLGKAAKVHGEATPRSTLDRRSPTGFAQEASPADPAAAAAAGKAPGKRAAGQSTTLQLDQVRRQGSRRPGARRSPPSTPQQQQEPSQPATVQLGDSNTKHEAPRGSPSGASQAAAQVLCPAPAAQPTAALATTEKQGKGSAEQVFLAAGQAAAAGAASPAAAVPLPARRMGTMASLLEERPKGSSPKVTAITAPRPILAAEPHHLSRLGDSSQESALTSSQAPATSKPWDNPSEEQKQAEEKQRRAEKAEQQKDKEEQRRVKDQLKTLQEIEAGLDRGSTSVQGIREMTALVLSPSAQGLEPRIVRGIIERLQQQDIAAAHAELSPATSKKKVALLYVLDSVLKAAKSREEKLGPREPAMVKSFQRFANAAAVGMPSLVAATHGDPHCYEKTLKRIADAALEGKPFLVAAPHGDPHCYEKTLKVFKVWDERGVLSKKVVQPHLEELRKASVSDAQPEESAQPGEDFGLRLADDDASDKENGWEDDGAASVLRGYRRDNFAIAKCTCRLRLADDEDNENEDGWEDDGAAPTLNDLPKLPQVVEALKAPWQRSGGTDRAVGVAPHSPEGSPWHQGPSPNFTLPGEAYPVGPPGQDPGSIIPAFEEKAAKAPWHQPPAPAERPLHNGALQHNGVPQQQAPRPLYPHQIGQYQPHLPQPPACAVPATTAAAPYAVTNSASRAYAVPSTAAAAYTAPITLRPPGRVPLPVPLAAPGCSFGQPMPRQPVSMPQQQPYQDFGRQISMMASADPGFMPPLPPDEPPPLPNEAPPPLPDEAPPPLPADDDMDPDASPSFVQHQGHALYQQQPVHAYGQGF